MLKAEDMGISHRIPADNRDLNYAKYFSEGEEDISKSRRLSFTQYRTTTGVEGPSKTISGLPLIRKEVFVRM